MLHLMRHGPSVRRMASGMWMSVDPGGATGWALWRGRSLVETGVAVGRGDDWVEACKVAHRLVAAQQGSVLLWVVEDFLLRGDVASTEREGLAPVYVTSSLCAELFVAEGSYAIVRQSASDAKGVITDDRLRRWDGGEGWKGLVSHERDAIRHGLLFMRKCNL